MNDDNLRCHIAVAAYNAYSGQWAEWESVNETCRNDWLEVADAVIRELGLRDEATDEAL